MTQFKNAQRIHREAPDEGLAWLFDSERAQHFLAEDEGAWQDPPMWLVSTLKWGGVYRVTAWFFASGCSRPVAATETQEDAFVFADNFARLDIGGWRATRRLILTPRTY